MAIHDYELSIKQQKDILAASEDLFVKTQAKYEKADKPIIGLFISDLHMPYHDVTAWELLKEILRDIAPQKGYFSVQNDWNDLSGWSLRFADDRPVTEKLGESDFGIIKRNEIAMIKELQEAVPYLKPVQVLGNHDQRLYSKGRNKMPDISEWLVAEYMSALWEVGVIQFSRGLHLNWVKLAPDLIWHHGMSAAQSPMSVAKKHISYFMENGIAYNVVYGHTHRPSVTEGHSIGYNGVKAVNAPCMCRNKDVSYLTAGYAPQWNLGISLSTFFPHKRMSTIENIVFFKDSEIMFCTYQGKRYETELQ